MKVLFSFLVLLIASWNIQAENTHFSVQIQAAKKPDLSNYKKLSKYGTPYTEKVSANVTRVKIGSYHNRFDAERALRKIRDQGFSDAFITEFTGKVAITTKKKKQPKVVVAKDKTSIDKKTPPKKSISWSTLTDEQKNDVVYVDDVLHLQRDGEFIPLTGYKQR